MHCLAHCGAQQKNLLTTRKVTTIFLWPSVVTKGSFRLAPFRGPYVTIFSKHKKKLSQKNSNARHKIRTEPFVCYVSFFCKLAFL